MKELIQKIHAAPHKAVLAITGGGTEVIGEFLKYGGGSATVLEAVVPYHQKSFDAFLKGKPDKYCSAGAARDLAMAAYQRAIDLTKDDPSQDLTELIGVGASCTLTKENEREGRRNVAFMAFQTYSQTITYTLEIPRETREWQEALIASHIIALFAEVADIQRLDGRIRSSLKYERAEIDLSISDIAFRRIGCRIVFPTDRFDNTDLVVFPGAFNPWHSSHQKIVEKAHEITGLPVSLELCIRNVDKPALNFQEINNRINSLSELFTQKPGRSCFNSLQITSASTFAEKAKLFPNATFVVGWDTFVRIGDPKYADLNYVEKTFAECKTKFLVFHRLKNGKDMSEFNQPTPAFLRSRATIIGPEVLEPTDISSSEIRRNGNHS